MHIKENKSYIPTRILTEFLSYFSSLEITQFCINDFFAKHTDGTEENHTVFIYIECYEWEILVCHSSLCRNRSTSSIHGKLSYV